MDLKKLKEPLTIEDIDFRVQSINKGGYATILAYKDARVDMNRLDDVCGSDCWQRNHKEIKNVIYCGIGINVTDGTGIDIDPLWVWKWDAGTESMAEKQKGEASDSFKRAGFNWGIGRELYDYPVISVKLLANEWELKTISGKKYPKATWDLKLKEWKWISEFKDGKITGLAAQDNNGATRFNWGKFTK
jgi:hypothetical protein